jgi:hypothetical protein
MSPADHISSLLLIRLLIDAYDPSGAGQYPLPTIEELARGVTDPASRVTYGRPTTAEHYVTFRTRLEQLFEWGLVGARRLQAMRQALQPFDEAFAWTPQPARSRAPAA